MRSLWSRILLCFPPITITITTLIPHPNIASSQTGAGPSCVIPTLQELNEESWFTKSDLRRQKVNVYKQTYIIKQFIFIYYVVSGKGLSRLSFSNWPKSVNARFADSSFFQDSPKIFKFTFLFSRTPLHNSYIRSIISISSINPWI